MRLKVCVLLASVVASTLMLPIATAGAAGGTVCRTDSATVTFSPTLPKSGSSQKVNSTAYDTNGRYRGCNNGVTGGTWTATTKFNNTNCANANDTKHITHQTIHWSPGGTSTLRLVLSGSDTGGTSTGIVTAGRFKGTAVTIHEIWVIPNGADHI
jgi:hypothetical protein